MLICFYSEKQFLHYAWEQRKVGDLGNIVTGSTPPTSDPTNYGGNYLFVSPADIQDNRYVKTTITKLSEKGFKKCRILKEGSTLFVSIGSTIGKVAQTEGIATTNQQINSIEPSKKYNDNFIYSLMTHNSKGIKELAATQAVPIVNKTSFSEVNVMIPLDIDEQIQIGNLFKNLDQLITLHQRKLDMLKKMKRAYLQQMFPQNDEDVPRLRFADFEGEWEQRKLGDVTNIYDGTHQTPDYKNKGIMFLSVENIKTLQSEKYISEEAFVNEFKVHPENGDVLMTRIGDIGTANVIESDEPIAYYVSLALLKKRKLNPYFLQSSIHSPAMKNEIWKRTLHIAFPKKINKNEIANLPIRVPNKEEQDKIGIFFKQLEDNISLNQAKLDKLNILKKSYLQKMFM